MPSVSNNSVALGGIDWVTIRASAHSWTFEELSHYSHCGVDPYVIAVARALCSQFQISTSARKEIERLREELDASEDHSSEHVLRMLTASDEGLAVFGVCGILNDRFHWAALAEFFEVLCVESGMPETLRPARGRWLEVARIAGKIRGSDSFDTLARRYSQLGLAGDARTDDLEECAGPLVMTGYIQGMSMIRSGEDGGRIVMLCGRSAGWHAAIAEWMFDLKIRLTTRDGTTFEGNTVYSNCPGDQVPLVITFRNPGVPCNGEPIVDPPMPLKNAGGA